MEPKVLTVSIAGYNVASTLEEALDPFFKCKTLDKIEVLIVNDGSTDRTEEIAEKYVRQSSGSIRLINKENGGWGSTLNAAVQAGHGKYFKQLDGDDFYSYENLDDFVLFLEQNDSDIVYSPFVTFDDKTGAVLRVVGGYDGLVPYRETIRISEMEDFCPAMHTLCVKLDILQKNNMRILENCFYTDVEFVLKSCHYAKTIAFYEFPVYYYRLARAGQSMSIQGVRKHYKDHMKMLLSLLAYEKEFINTDTVKKIFHRRLSSACGMQYIFFLALEGTDEQRREMKEFDQILKKQYPSYYEGNQNHAVSALRKMNFHGYKGIGKLQTMRDKKKKINIFEGN